LSLLDNGIYVGWATSEFTPMESYTNDSSE
jgi:hypothetical protein